MGKNRYYCKINNNIENLQDIQELIDNKEFSGKITLAMYERHNMNIVDANTFEEVLKFNNWEIPVDYNECLKRMQDYNQTQHTDNRRTIITCPYCNSSNVKKIGVGGRILSTATLGLAGKVGKQWHCNSCKSDF